MEREEIERLVTPLLEQEGAELVDLQYRKEGPKWVLRLFLDKQGGVTIDDCAYFSDRIGAMIDATEAIKQSYVLEVSSPGLDRVIKKDKDFERFSGKAVKLRLKLPDQGQRNFRGKLLGLREGQVLVESAGQARSFARESIEELRLDDAAEF